MVPVGSYHTPFWGTQLCGFGILTPKLGNQGKGYGISLQVYVYIVYSSIV